MYSRGIGRIWRVAEGLEYGDGINEGIISTEIAPKSNAKVLSERGKTSHPGGPRIGSP